MLTAAALMAGLSLVRAAINADLITSSVGQAVPVLSIAVPLALIVAFPVWSNLTKRGVEAYGGTVAVVQNWALACGGLVLFLSYLLPMKTPTAFHVVRGIGAILVVVGALMARDKLRRWLNTPAAPATAPPAGALPSPAGAQTFLSAEPQPQDWNASVWDPEVQKDIERRRRRSRPTDAAG